MKKFALLAVALLAIVACGFGWQRWRTTRLRTPTPAQTSAAFPASTRDYFEHSGQFTLLALDAHAGSRAESRTRDLRRGEREFHGYAILGQTTLRDKALRQQVIAAFDDGIARGGGMAACFEPHHGLRAVKGGHTLDFVICFGCQQFERYLDGRLLINEDGKTLSISPHPQATFDDALLQAGVHTSTGR